MQFFNALKRKTIVAGHYGSGKTEFSVSLAMLLAKARDSNISQPRIALIDFDIVNPYFRSREQQKQLHSAGVSVYGSAYGTAVTAEIPELGATVRAPLEDSNTRVIVDLGGNDSGALVINQFTKYFTGDDTIMAAVVNANRPDTGTYDGVMQHISAIESATALSISNIINNTHLLRETTAGDIEKGHELCRKICETTGNELLCDCYPDGIVNPAILTGFSRNLMPMGLYMRPSYLDK